MSYESWKKIRERDDDFENAELIQTRRLGTGPNKGRAGTRPGERETVVVWGTEAERNVRRDDCNGYFIDGRTQ